MFAPPTGEQTLQAERDTRATAIADARATATLVADRANRTQEFAGTQVARAEVQTTRIVATLIAAGLSVNAGAITPAPPPTQATLGAFSGEPGFTVIEPTIIAQGGALGNSALVNPPAAATLPQPTLNPNGPNLNQLVLAEQVGADDCALSPTTTFTTAATDVYLVAMGSNLTPQNTLTARFFRDGTEQVFYTWTPGRNIDGACIWFHMPSSDVNFVAGNWSVALEVDEAPYGSPLPFTVTDSSGADTMDTMTEPTSSG